MVKLTRALAAFCIFSMLFIGILACGTGTASAKDWPKFLLNSENIPVCTESIPDGVEILWTSNLMGYSYSSPVVVDGRIYIGSGFLPESEDEQKYDILYCLDAETGDELWTFICAMDSQSDHGMCSTPTVEDGRVYFGSSDFMAFCLDAETGDAIWMHYLIEETHPYANYGACASPVVHDGKVYFGTDSFESEDDADQDAPNLYCLDAKGNGDGTTDVIWTYASPQDGYIYSTPAISGNRLVIGTWYATGEVVCLDTDGNGDGTTTQYWHFSIPEPTQASAAIHDGIVYIGYGDFTATRTACSVVAIDLNSQGELVPLSEEWRYQGSDVFGGTAVPYDGRIYVGDLGGVVHCINPATGIGKSASADWTFETGNQIWGTPTIADDRLIIGNFNGDLYCLETAAGETSTQEVWRIHLSDAEIYTSATLVDDKIYISTNDGKLFCLGAKGTGPGTNGHGGNIMPALTYGTVAPEDGDEDDEFTFSVLYTDLDNDAPVSIMLDIEGDNYDLVPDYTGPASEYDRDYTNGERYSCEVYLDAGKYYYYFEATDGIDQISTQPRTLDVAEAGGDNNGGDSGTGSSQGTDGDSTPGFEGVFVLAAIIAALIISKKRKG